MFYNCEARKKWQAILIKAIECQWWWNGQILKIKAISASYK